MDDDNCIDDGGTEKMVLSASLDVLHLYGSMVWKRGSREDSHWHLLGLIDILPQSILGLSGRNHMKNI